VVVTRHSDGDSRHLVDKIGDQELRRLAQSRGEHRVPVIVEVKTPQPTVELEPVESNRGASWRARAVRWSNDDDDRARRALDAAHTFLSHLLGVEPVALTAARAFAAEVNGEELRQIVMSKLTKAVYPDRKVR
jgi:hypothetical protein